MAHPKLATVVGRSVVTAATAALMVGPLAAAGAAAELLDPAKDLTCEEAKATEVEDLIKEFCDEPEAGATESPLDKSVDEVTETVDETVGGVPEDAPEADNGGGGGDDGGGSGDGGTTEPVDDVVGGKEVEKTDDGEGFTGVDEGSAGGSDDNRNRSREASRERAGAGAGQSAGYGYNADGPFRPGMRSNSSLTLQPFAAPLVSVPPVYELPQIASQLFGSDAAATAEDPLVAGAEASTATTASGYSPTGYTATSADPTGWLAATATGLIMLVGAAHAINGGRTPKGQRA